MKRVINFLGDDSNSVHQRQNKKAKLHKTCSEELSVGEIRAADQSIPYFLNTQKVSKAINMIKIMFDTPKSIERFLTHTNYYVLDWAIEHQSDSLIKYILEHDTGRGKVLAMEYQNHLLIKKFVDQIKQNHDSVTKSDIINDLKKLTEHYSDGYKQVITTNALEYAKSSGYVTDITNVVDNFELSSISSGDDIPNVQEHIVKISCNGQTADDLATP